MLGFSRITLLLFSVFMTLQIHRKELLTQSIWMLLAKPIPRISYIVGKYLGLLVVLFMLAFSMGLVIGGFLFFIDDKMALLSVFQAQLLLTLECGVLCAFTLLCAVLTGPLLAASFSISFWILASSHQPLNLVFSHKTNNPIWNLLKRGVPDFSLFDIRVHVPYGFQLSFQDIISLSFYGMCSVVFFLSIAAVLFENKDISA
jgi:ABC-type transport system involved in multi-copper enzyme maturation permease subunit